MFRAPQFRHHAAFEETNVDMREVSATEGCAPATATTFADVDVLLTHSPGWDLPIHLGAGERWRAGSASPRFVIDVLAAAARRSC